MDLKALSSNLPKPWLNIKCNTLEAVSLTAEDLTLDTLTVDEIETKEACFENQAGVPNPPIGSMCFFSDLTGILSSTDPLGNTVQYVTQTTFGSAVLSDGKSSNYGDIPQYKDNTGLLVGDSKVNTSSIIATIDQASPLCPAGLRDKWQTGDITNQGSGDEIVYGEEIDTLITTGTVSGQISYSIDGGANFILSAFDVAPDPGNGLEVGWNGAIFSAISYDPLTATYTSPDGINFTAGSVPPAGLWSWNMEWSNYLGLWLAGGLSGPINSIMTSPDAITWTNTPYYDTTIESGWIKSGENIVVQTVSLAPFCIYSTDGINWNPCVGMSNYCRVVTYSAERKEFLAMGNLSNNGFTSPDGMNWYPSVANLYTGFTNGLIWVGNNINRYYAVGNSTDGNYALFSTTDASKPFITTNLKGSILGDYTYARLAYSIQRNSFMYGQFNLPYSVVYSTPSTSAIKSISDNINVRGYPVSVSNYSTYGDTSCNNTVVETDISTTVQSLGSLTLQAVQPLGMVFKFDLNLALSSVGGDNVTIRFYTNGGLIFSHILSVPALSVSLPCNIQTTITVRNGAIQIRSTETLSGFVDMIQLVGVVYNRLIPNTWSITAEWGANVNQLTMTQLLMESHFPNGY